MTKSALQGNNTVVNNAEGQKNAPRARSGLLESRRIPKFLTVYDASIQCCSSAGELGDGEVCNHMYI